MREFWKFVRAFGTTWFSAVSGTIGVIATAVGLWGPSGMTAKWLFIAFGFVGLVAASFSVWIRERRTSRGIIGVYRSRLTSAEIRMKNIDDRLEDIGRQVANLNDEERAAVARLGRLGEIGQGDSALRIAARYLDFVIEDRGWFRATDAYRQALSAWAKTYAASGPAESPDPSK